MIYENQTFDGVWFLFCTYIERLWDIKIGCNSHREVTDHIKIVVNHIKIMVNHIKKTRHHIKMAYHHIK